MKKFVIALCGIAVSFSPLFAQVDPCLETDELNKTASGVQEFTANSSGNKPLSGSPYGYEMWTEGGDNNKLLHLEALF